MISKSAAVAVLITALTPLLSAQDEAALLATLNNQTSTLEQKQHACQRLAAIGTGDAVPALAGMLGDPTLAHSARYALETIPGPKVDAALREALPNLKGKELTGVINSIGVRRDAAAVPALAKLLKHPDTGDAAALSMGKIGTKAAADALLTHLEETTPEQLATICAALMRAADALATDGKANDSINVCTKIFGLSNVPPTTRCAAWVGIVRNAPERQRGILMSTFRTGDDPHFTPAVQLIMDLKAPDLATNLAGILYDIPEHHRILVIQALAERGDPIAAPALIKQLNTGTPPVRIAAAKALTRLAHPAAIPALATMSRQPDSELTTVARDCLANFPHPDADIAIAILLTDEMPDKRILATKLAAPRDPAVVIPVLLATSTDRNESVATAALATLRDLAGLDELPELLNILLDANSPAVTQATSHAIVALCARQPKVDAPSPACVDPLVTALQKSSGPSTAALIKILQRLGGPKAEAAIRDATEN